MWLRNLFDRFPVGATVHKAEMLALSVGSDGVQTQHALITRARLRTQRQSEAWWGALFNYRQFDAPELGCQLARLPIVLVLVLGMIRAMTMTVTVVLPAAEQPGAGNVHQQADERDWDGLCEVDRDR